MKQRTEKDTLGEISVPDERYWGAQTQRSLENFPIGEQTMPKELIKAFGFLKKACAEVNAQRGALDKNKADAIMSACDDVISSKLKGEFPLKVWQTGSGTQTNMNVNEVIANRATEIMGGNFRKEKLVHPNDDVNMSQSSNDTFPTAMRIAEVSSVHSILLSAIDVLHKSLLKKQEEFKDIVKIGRTHLQDATPLTLGQEFSGYASMLELATSQIKDALVYCSQLPIGGTAVGTGLNAPADFDEKVSQKLNEYFD